MANFEKKLPTEQWHQVLRNVSHGDLCNVMLTSRHMNRVASWPELWVGMKVNLGKMRENGLAQFYSINRFKRIKQIDFGFRGGDFTFRELFDGIREIDFRGGDFTFTELFDRITEIDFRGGDFTFMELFDRITEIDFRGGDFTFTELFDRITSIDFRGGAFTSVELERLFTEFPRLPLESVNFAGIYLGRVRPELLVSAVGRLKTIILRKTHLTTNQCVKVLETSISSEKLVEADLSWINLSGVPPVLLATAVSRLNTVKLIHSRLSTDQCIKVLETSISSKTLDNLELSGNILGGVPPNLLASAVSRLKNANLNYSRLTTDHCIKVLEASISSATLVSIDLSTNNLIEVQPNLLASAVGRRKTVNLEYSELTTDQCIKVLEASISSTTLISINLSWNNLSGVPPVLLASAISRLKTASLVSSGLTTDQCIKVLEASISSTTLVKVEWSGNNLGGVPPNLLASAFSCLKNVKLYCLELTTDQCIKVLEASISSTTLVSINLAEINLGGVPPNLLANAVSHLKTVKLDNPRLTTDQCIQILEASISSTTMVSIVLIRTDLNGVPPNLLASAVSRLKTVALDNAGLTTDQCVKVLEASISSTTLVSIALNGTNLSGVPSNLLASAVSRLKTVRLDNSGLTTDQCIRILEASISSTTLVNMYLWGIDLSGVPPILLADAVSRLKTVMLISSRLTPDQCVALLMDISSTTTLSLVNLSENDFGNKIPIDLQYLITSLPSYVIF